MQLSHLHQQEPRYPSLIASVLMVTGLFILFSGTVNYVGLILFVPERLRDINQLIALITQKSLSPSEINGLLIWQGFSALAGFVMAPLAYLFFLDKHLLSYVRQNTEWKWQKSIVILALAVLVQPIIDFTYSLNQQMVLPESFSGLETAIRESENQLKLITQVIAQPVDWQGWLLAVMVIVAIPALGEELFFRGTLQSLLLRARVNVHLSIWLTAFLFSALHFQFYGFVPRMLMGALFGYIYFYTGSLPLSILAHGVNNLLVLIVLNVTGNVDNTIGDSGIWSLLSVPIIVLGFRFLQGRKLTFRFNSEKKGWVIVYRTPLSHRAELIAGIIEKSGFPVMVLNKVDSNFHFGDYQVLVKAQNEAAAKEIISDAVSFE